MFFDIYSDTYFFGSKWQLCHHSIPFGPLFWCQIVVEEGEVECEMLLNQETPTETGKTRPVKRVSKKLQIASDRPVDVLSKFFSICLFVKYKENTTLRNDDSE